MARKEKPYYDEQGNFIIRPYRMKDLTAIYGVSGRTLRRWIESKAPDYANKTKMFYSIEQVRGIVMALGIPQIIAPVVTLGTKAQAA